MATVALGFRVITQEYAFHRAFIYFRIMFVEDEDKHMTPNFPQMGEGWWSPIPYLPTGFSL
jgi:uncharacterized membrane protein